MTKLKSTKLKLYGVIALALALGVTGAYKGVKAFQSSNAPKIVAEAGSTVNLYEAPGLGDAEGAQEELLGNVSDPRNPNCQNNECTWIVTGDFKDATTTFVSVQDPFLRTTSTGGVELKFEGGVGCTGASTTVDLVRLYQTGANTSSYGVACGPSTGAVATGQIIVAKEIVTTTLVGGSTQIATNTLGVLENNMTGAQGNRVDGGTVAKVMMGPSDPYFVCLAQTTSDGTNSIINADNTFAGKYVIRFKRLLY